VIAARLALVLAAAMPALLSGQAGDSLATARIQVEHDGNPVEAALVRSGRLVRQTDHDGLALLRLMAGRHTVIVSRIGYRADSSHVVLRPGQDTTLTIRLEALEAQLEEIVVSATRSERRVEDTPLRVEVIDGEEIGEKIAMTPGDIAMMLNETAGLRVQTTSPSLGGANVRIQGLAGRYSLLLADGLPLYGGQAGGLGLLQIPPVDLGRVEIIKGSASALYGSAALGGVVNLVSRRPGSDPEATVILNGTSREGSDAVFYGTAPLSSQWGYSLLAGGHGQVRNDLDGDGWTDMPGYRRAVVRPRFYYADGRGRTAFVTAGLTAEQREGGTLPGRTAPDGQAFLESLRTYRFDLGGLARWIVTDGILEGAIVSVRGSAMEQRHAHRFGTIGEDDRHRTVFAEAAVAVPRGPVTYVAGAAFQRDAYRASSLPTFDYTHSAPALFAQIDLDPAPWTALSASGRVDQHSVYGTFLNPRISLLLRRPTDHAGWAGWTARLSGGTGAFAPTPFTETTEVTGLTPLLLPSGLVAERARNLSLDIGGPVATALGRFELNGTLFASQVRHPVQVEEAPGIAPGGARRLQLVNASEPTRVWGSEVLVRLVHRLDGEDEDEDEHAGGTPDHHGGRALRITATYTHLRSTECGPGSNGCLRRATPLTPRHAVGLVTSVEEEGKSRVGLELYYTGRQALDQNPYRRESRPYLVVGLLAERQFGSVRVFVNGENLADVRQTRVHPLVLPSRGEGGRWTTDVWSLLEGRTVNGGVRIALRRAADHD